jgi:hypothetical protein
VRVFFAYTNSHGAMARRAYAAGYKGLMRGGHGCADPNADGDFMDPYPHPDKGAEPDAVAAAHPGADALADA